MHFVKHCSPSSPRIHFDPVNLRTLVELITLTELRRPTRHVGGCGSLEILRSLVHEHFVPILPLARLPLESEIQRLESVRILVQSEVDCDFVKFPVEGSKLNETQVLDVH